MRLRLGVLYGIIIIGFCTCKQPYTPAPITTPTNYLVVEGLINITDSTYINLSRTVTISAKSTVKPELKAVVTIESNSGNSYPLKELGNGVYTAAPLGLSAAGQYRLRIKASSGSTYVSDFTNAMVSPPIDSITWKLTGTGINFYASTHDPKNATRYYRWDFNEAWEFRSDYQSFFVSDGLTISFRQPSQQIWDCFTGDNSTAISLGTSIQLSDDVINQAQINEISSDAEKISIKYTIGARQYALTKDAYDYWTLLKKNTEQLGSVFDSQPSASIGNIHCITNPAEPVIGFISAGTITTSRIFITRQQLPTAWITTPAYPIIPDCGSVIATEFPSIPRFPLWDEVLNYKSPFFDGPTALGIPIEYASGANPIYSYAAPFCVDCTLRGSKKPPAYWK